MSEDSRKVPVFPTYHLGGQGNVITVQSFVRKKFWRRWYLIPVITRWETPKPFYDGHVITEVIQKHQADAYNVLLFFKYMKPDGHLHTQLRDEYQEDERTRLGIGL